MADPRKREKKNRLAELYQEDSGLSYGEIPGVDVLDSESQKPPRQPSFVGPPDLAGPPAPAASVPAPVEVGDGGDEITLRQKIQQGAEQIKDKPADKPAETQEGAAADVTQTFKRVGIGGGQPSKSGSQLAYEDYEKALKELNAKEMQAEDPGAQSVYRKAQDEAKRLFEERENRVAWASLAETIGTGLLKLGMAETAKKGVDLSRIQWEKPTDWEPTLARYERRYMADVEAARKDYVEAKDAAEKAKGAEAKNLQRAAELKKDIYEQKLRQEEKARDRAAEAEKERLRLEAEKERERKRDEATLSKERRQEGKDEAAARAGRISEARLRLNTDPELKDINEEIKKVSNQESVFARVSNALQASDLSSRSLDKLDLKLISDAGAAGIDLDALKKELEKTETVRPALLGGKSKEEEASEKKKIINEYTGTFRQALDQLRAQRKQRTDRLLSSIGDAEVKAEAAAEVAPEVAPKSALVRVRGPSGQVAEMSEEKAKKYLDKPGYSLVK